jgi:hypothetical protein
VSAVEFQVQVLEGGAYRTIATGTDRETEIVFHGTVAKSKRRVRTDSGWSLVPKLRSKPLQASECWRWIPRQRTGGAK